MIERRLLVFATTCTIALACDPRASTHLSSDSAVAVRESTGTSSPARPAAVVDTAVMDSTPTLNEEDERALSKYLSANERKAVRVLAQNGPYHAILVEHVRGPVHSIMFLKVQSGRVIALREPLSERRWGMSEFPQPEWVSLNGEDVDHLALTIYTLDLFRIEEDTLVNVYSGEFLGCRPAELRDVDADGIPELLEYIAGPNDPMCDDICVGNVSSYYGVTADWVRASKWVAGQWVAAEEEFPEFYGSLVRRYEHAIEWLSMSPDYMECRTKPWMAQAKVFDELLSRARVLAGGN